MHHLLGGGCVNEQASESPAPAQAPAQQNKPASKRSAKQAAQTKQQQVSGTRADRPGLAKTFEMLRDGDTLVVWKLDRLGRSVGNLPVFNGR